VQEATPHKARGFSVIEMMLTVAIAAILYVLSVPTIDNLIQSSKSSSAQTALLIALNLARSTAIVRQSEVAICPSTDLAHCDRNIWWQRGWIVFQDIDGDGVRKDSEPLLSVTQAQSGMAVASSSGRQHVTYRADGTATGTNLTFTVCDRRGPRYASTIVVSNIGRPRHGQPTKEQATTACAGL
jgi:type IV fimbrial biogenesis protein FimT